MPTTTKSQPVSRRRSYPALSREAIVLAARRIADEDGVAELTLRRLGAEFGTGPASLYRHIADREELLRLLSDDLAAGYPVVRSRRADPVERIVAQWQAIRRYLDEHPWSARLIADGQVTLGSVTPVAEHCLVQLAEAGLSRADALRTYRALWHLLIGHLLNAHPFGHLHGAGPAPRDFEWAVRALVLGAAR